MAAVETVSKSQAVRDYLSEHPGAGPKEIITELRKAGVFAKSSSDKVYRRQVSLVSNVKTSLKKASGTKTKTKSKAKSSKAKTTAKNKAAAKSKAPTKDYGVTQALKAKDLANSLGGTAATQDLLGKIQEIQPLADEVGGLDALAELLSLVDQFSN
ncbi:MAG: hypothetical protein ACYSW3_30320 [Planctomycetota bacterium]|jgi:hypothetical protein